MRHQKPVRPLFFLSLVSLCLAPLAQAQWLPAGATNVPIYYTGGNVAIGSTTANNKLEVGSAALGTLGGTAAVVSNTSGNSVVSVGQSATARGRLVWIFNAVEANAYMALGSPNAQPLVLQDGGVGKVGIANTNPAYQVEVGTSFAGETSTIVTNADTGSTSFASVGARNAAATANVFRMLAMGTGWATTGAFLQNSGVLQAGANLTGGISILTANTAGAIRLYTGGQNQRVIIDPAGNVGIGTPVPSALLHVAGAAQVDGNLHANGTISGGNVVATYQDVAEWVPSGQRLLPGTVVTINTGKKNEVLPSSRAYDTTVAGVVSEKPGVLLGVEGDTKSQIATTGRVRVHADATSHSIVAGDLLVTSTKPGMAMCSEPVDLGGVKIHRPGTIIGKALEPLPSGEGDILVLLTLQ